MKGLKPLFLGLFATFAFSWLGLALIPNSQIGHLDPQSDEEGTDVYPMPQSGMVERGRKVYTGNGCFYCHTQQVRPDTDSADIARKWGERRSAPRDYIFARPVALGRMRMGPDLSNVGKRAPAGDESGAAPATSPAASPAAPPSAPTAGASPAASPGIAPAPAASGSPVAAASSPAASAPATSTAPKPPAASPAGASPSGAAPAAGASQAASLDSNPNPNGAPPQYSAAWHHQHLYAPRSLDSDSNMPAYRFLYEKRRVSGERSSDALTLNGPDAPGEGWEVVPSYEAKCLVAYLMSLDQSHPLKEVQSNTPPSPPAPGKGATK